MYDHPLMIFIYVQGYTETVAGTGERGFKDGPVEEAMFDRPHGLAVDHMGNVYVADTHNHRIRIINADTGECCTCLFTNHISLLVIRPQKNIRINLF